VKLENSGEAGIYEQVDPVLDGWAAKNGLTLYTEHKGEPVRTAVLVGKGGAKVQIWVQPGPTADTWEVYVWDYHKRKKHWRAAAHLEGRLIDAYKMARTWLD
jgi:hypothetical protein